MTLPPAVTRQHHPDGEFSSRPISGRSNLLLVACACLLLSRVASAAPELRPERPKSKQPITHRELPPEPSNVVIELDEAAEEHVDPRLVRRLVRLELADIPVPPPYSSPKYPKPPTYVRILLRDEVLVVELWDHGLLHGERRVSIRGGKSLTARSIALVSAELARRLAEQRKLEARAAAIRENRARRRSLEKRGFPIFARLALSGSVQAASVGVDDAWMVGPGAEAQLRFDDGLRLALGARGHTGTLTELDTRFQWLELNLTPGYALRVSRRSTLALGLVTSFASVSLASVNRVDGSASSSTWNSRVGLRADYALTLGPRFDAQFGAEAGSTLRKVEVTVDDDESTRFGGLWVGIGLGFNYDRNRKP